MRIETIPRISRTEAEQVAEHIWARWTGLTGKAPPIITSEQQADVVQAIYLKACSLIEDRAPEP